MKLEDPVESFKAFRALPEDDKSRLQAYAAALMLKHKRWGGNY
jgi:hypothetical protein